MACTIIPPNNSPSKKKKKKKRKINHESPVRVVNGYYKMTINIHILLSHFHNTYVNETTVYEKRIN